MTESSDFLGSLMQQLGGEGVNEIARSVGLDGSDVGNVLAGAVPAMMAGLSRNAASGGTESLLGALDRNHDGSVLDDVMGYLAGGGNITDGAGILGHVLGGGQDRVASAVSRSTGIDMASVVRIMAMVAPLIMGALGKAKRQQGLDASGLSDLLTQQTKAARAADPSAVDVFMRMLDSDGDGDAMDDIVKLGSGLLGSLFKA